MSRHEVKIFYLLSFLGGFAFNIVAPLFVVFGLSLGFTIAQIGILLGASRFSILIFEVPTGIFADSFGRKKSILLTYFLSIFSALIYFYTSNFYSLLIGSIISGLALSFMSGAFEALAVDSLGLTEEDHLRDKVFVRISAAATIGFIAGGFAGSGISYFNLRYIWLFQAIVAIIALILSWKLLEEKFYPQEKLNMRENYIKIAFSKIKNPLNFIFKEKKIFSSLIITIFIALTGAIYLLSWPIIFKDILSIPIHYFGIISGAAGAFFLIGSFIAEKYSLKKGAINTLISCLVLISAFYIIFALSKNVVLSLLSFIMIDFLNGGFIPLFYSLLNKFIPSSGRATILSFFSLTEKGSAGVGEIIAGTLLTVMAAPFVALLSPILIFIVLLISFFTVFNFNKWRLNKKHIMEF